MVFNGKIVNECRYCNIDGIMLKFDVSESDYSFREYNNNRNKSEMIYLGYGYRVNLLNKPFDGEKEFRHFYIDRKSK